MSNVTQWVYGKEKYVTVTDWPHTAMQSEHLYLNSIGKLTTAKYAFTVGENFILEAPTFGLCSNTVETVTIGVAALLQLPCLQNNSRMYPRLYSTQRPCRQTII
ncbi:hypothetical protein HLH10_15705 [Acinetobacter sp. ANC 4277]|uniref:hypothetical protein n=1 Tax=Acinetobacter terrae TaxID=2731247 RepID=UPI001490092F|nr:hypothetical protein [Acinetobacter terrae]NNG77673.1 hypothetical protein [Acinetobacter terrae]